MLICIKPFARSTDSRQRPPTHEDVALQDLANELVELAVNVAAWREIALAAFAKVHEQQRKLTRRDNTIAALRDELRRYTAAACRPDRERVA